MMHFVHMSSALPDRILRQIPPLSLRTVGTGRDSRVLGPPLSLLSTAQNLAVRGGLSSKLTLGRAYDVQRCSSRAASTSAEKAAFTSAERH